MSADRWHLTLQTVSNVLYTRGGEGGGEMMRLLEGINCSGKVATYGNCVVPNFSVSIQKHHPCMGGDAYKAVVLQSIALK